ncbi:MAG TPA: response regulator [Terriglobales bacterium]|nr:response regulator [Terriglobales bacterium]
MARRVLLADDSVTAQNMGRRILIDAGYEVITVNNGSAALKKIAENKPDLIIVDVYMPGYGGLEVCSRVKETKETSRIPVLLTVGKLEPFKPEEARKARADAFIVKPFEASELLTALTKLEDKIVPGPEPYKPGRFAKALASVEGSADKAESFGDVESGWKNRLTIPPPHMKPAAHAEPEPEAVKPAAASVELGREEDFKPAEPRGFERPLPAGLPQDIRPEEIAAIAAAAAALRGDLKPEEKPAVSEVSVEEPQQAESPAPPEAIAETQPQCEETAGVEAVAAEVPREEEPVAQGEVVAEAKPSEQPEAEKVTGHDAEVLAALASLTPANGDYSSETREEEPVTVAVGAAVPELEAVGASYTGPRWIAEAISVPIEEATRPLEQEMYKAFAAFAAADGLKLLGAVELAAPPAEAVPEPIAPAEADAVAEPLALPTSEPVVAAESAMAAAAGAGEIAAPVISQDVSALEVPASETAEGEPRREAELAAAWENWRHIRQTIIGPDTAPAMTEPETAAEVKEEAAPVEARIEETKVEEPETAESKVEEAKPDEAVAEIAPAEVQIEEPQPEPVAEAVVASPEPQPEAKSDSETESGDQADSPEAIASIVDDMLADLKPKLMEELSKKLSKGKKKKKS